MGINNNRLVIQERRNKVWTLITKGLKRYQIAQELNVDPGTISRDIKHLTAESQNYLNDLARSYTSLSIPNINFRHNQHSKGVLEYL